MLRLPSQQVFKALRNHLPRPICNPLRNLCNPLQTRHIHGLEAPYEGPASYATITRRFASHPNPLVFFTEKKAKEAVERGEFVDIHDIGRTDPKDYDVLITDMSERILRDSISKLAAETLGLTSYDPGAATIAGYNHLVQLAPKDSHFTDVNLLGADFINISKLRYWPDFREKTVRVYFGHQWEAPRHKL